jgi:hypothetical protein
MELEIKHLTPYLPYSLRLQYIVRENVVREGVMRSITFYESETHPARVSIDHYNEEHIWMFRPLLKPMSLLTIEEAGRHMKLFIESDLDFIIGSPLSCHYEELEYLYSQHYDVFGLIEKGLGVSIKF